jgi:hypothetical protein
MIGETGYGSVESKGPDAVVGFSQCETAEQTTPVIASPSNGNNSFLNMFSAFACCVAPRKANSRNRRESVEPLIGTGARSRQRKFHLKNKHSGHNHIHPDKQTQSGTGSRDSVLPSSSAASSASLISSPILENWMERFSDWRVVDIPIFPGTHHSGVNNPRKKTSQPVWGWAKTQDIGIEEQLHIGVRFFDLRIRVIVKTGEVLISHGLTSDTSLQDALEVIGSYLSSHSSEGVILYIRADKWHGIDKESSDLLTRVLQKASIKLCPVENRASHLGGLRMKHLAGHALIISPEGTLNDSIPQILPTCLQYCDIWQENSIEDAKAKVEQYMTKIPEGPGDSFGGIALDGTFPIRQQSQTSRELNQWFIEKLSNDDTWKDRIELHQFGIVLIDFADFDILNFFIGINNKLIGIRNST